MYKNSFRFLNSAFHNYWQFHESEQKCIHIKIIMCRTWALLCIVLFQPLFLCSVILLTKQNEQLTYNYFAVPVQNSICTQPKSVGVSEILCFAVYWYQKPKTRWWTEKVSRLFSSEDHNCSSFNDGKILFAFLLHCYARSYPGPSVRVHQPQPFNKRYSSCAKIWSCMHGLGRICWFEWNPGY